MNINDFLNKIAKQLSYLYGDEIDVYRSNEIISTCGDIQEKEVKIYSNIKGRCDPIEDDLSITDNIEEDKGLMNILCILPIEYKIIKGDWFVIRRLGKNNQTLQVYEGKANEPQVYPSHQEIIIRYKASE